MASQQTPKAEPIAIVGIGKLLHSFKFESD